MGEDKFDSALEQIEKHHDSYRASGIALMTTVIGLSSGLLYAYRGDLYSARYAHWLISAIFFSLVQEACHYLASLLRARSQNHVPDAVIYARKGDLAKADNAFQEYGRVKKWSDRTFNLADGLCFLAVVVLIIAIYKMYFG